MSKTNRPLTPEEFASLTTINSTDLLKVFPNHTRDWLKAQKRAAHAKQVKKPTLTVAEAAAQRAQAITRVDGRRQYAAALDEITRLRALLDASLMLEDPTPAPVKPIASTGKPNRAVAIVQASDWHAEQEVKLIATNGLNDYNLDIFRERANNFFVRTGKLITWSRARNDLDTLVVHIGGDMINGSIHEENLVDNQLGPMAAARLVEETIIGGLEYWLKELNLKRLVLVFSIGNHSRGTKKPWNQAEAENSVEYLVYHYIASYFHNDARVESMLPHSRFTYLQVLNTMVRFHHGHSIHYQGGVGGITIPINKAIAAENRTRRADLDVFGHFHTRFDGGNFLVNGSLIGYSSYSMNNHYPFEPAAQQFCLIDEQHGKSVVLPIWVD